MKLQDRYAKALIALGETEIHGKSLKYRVFTRKAGGFYYLGRAGAIRVGPNLANSVAMFIEARPKGWDSIEC